MNLDPNAARKRCTIVLDPGSSLSADEEKMNEAMPKPVKRNVQIDLERPDEDIFADQDKPRMKPKKQAHVQIGVQRATVQQDVSNTNESINEESTLIENKNFKENSKLELTDMPQQRRRSGSFSVQLQEIQEKKGRKMSQRLDFRRRSTRRESFIDVSRRMTLASRMGKLGRTIKKCSFETGKYTIKALIDSILEQMEGKPRRMHSDFEELLGLIETLSDNTFDERDNYIESVIRLHIAQRKLIDYPKNIQNEIDNMALEVRRQNKELIAKLHEEDKNVKEEIEHLKQYATDLSIENKNFIKEKEISDELMSTLVNMLNMSMSEKAQSQIELNKTVNLIAVCEDKIHEMPERFEMLKENVGGEIEEYKYRITKGLERCESVRDEIRKTVAENVVLKKEMEMEMKKEKEYSRSLMTSKTKLDEEKQRLKRVVVEADCIQNDCEMKCASRNKKEREKISAEKLVERTLQNDESEFQNWKEKVHTLTVERNKTKRDVANFEYERKECENQEMEITFNMKGEERAKSLLQSKTDRIQVEEESFRQRFDAESDQRQAYLDRSVRQKEEALITRQLLENDVDLETKNHAVNEQKRREVVAEWNVLDTAITRIKKDLVDFLATNNKIVTNLEDKVRILDTQSKSAAKHLKLQMDRLKEDHGTLQSNIKRFSTQEADFRERIRSQTQQIKSATGQIDETSEILTEREPHYKEIQISHQENEKLYREIKYSLVEVQNQEKQIKDKIEMLEEKKRSLAKIFTTTKCEKGRINDQMISIVAEKSDQIKHVDGLTYNLLVEWEQYEQENQRIEGFRSEAARYIRSMLDCNQYLTIQLIDHGWLLEGLGKELQQSREVFRDFFRKSDITGNEILARLQIFDTDTKERENLTAHVNSKLSTLVNHLESTINDVDLARPKTTQEDPIHKFSALGAIRPQRPTKISVVSK